MFELIAQGSNSDARWRRQLPDQPIEIGRATPAYRVPWDNQVSRRHVRVTPGKKTILVEKISEASNPVFFNGQEEILFELKPGEHFVIGKTAFTLAADRAFVSLEVPNPISQKTYSPEYLRQLPYRDADRRIEILNRIPDAISSSVNVEDLLIQMVNTLIAGIGLASTVGIVQLKQEPGANDLGADETCSIEIIQWDRRGLDGGDFQPSESLIRQAIETNESILHIWNQRKRVEANYTYDYANDWAFATPISSVASPGWGIYVAGTNRGSGSSLGTDAGEEDLQGDIKFCELVGSTLKNLLLVKQLERQQSSLRAFFSPIVMEAFIGRDPDEVLTPRKCDMSVMFCDLRGFSKTSEEMADNLLALLEQVSESMGVMTAKILDHGGVIGDFHGDSAMGFWGWPLEPTRIEESAASAVLTALEIQKEVDAQWHPNDARQFKIGMGIASGEAVAGKIGSRDQVKVTAFGPVVNLASRLEGMTRMLGSSILADGETVQRIASCMLPAEMPTVRSLGNFQPFGLQNSLEIFQIFPAGAIEEAELSTFREALQYFQSGDWSRAFTTLAALPADDSAQLFISDFIERHQRVVPPDWLGVIRMQKK